MLLDTGVWISLIDRKQRTHADAVEAFRNTAGRIFSTEAVLTETLYMLRRQEDTPRVCLDYVIKDIVNLVALGKPDISRISALMKKYSDVPMDFADSTLVAVGEGLGIDTVLTFDRRGFEIYRMFGSRPFNILP